MYDMMIIGAGPAGLSAAIYGVRAGKSVLVLEGKTYGGQIINTPEVENYPGIRKVSGFEFATGLYQQAKELGAEIKMEKVLSIEKGSDMIIRATTAKGTYDAKTVILAVGARKRMLGLSREEELIGAGVSYCATCDGMFYQGKTVAVNGGGSTALEDALFLSNYCKEVYLIHRRDSFRGEQKLVDALKEKENVVFVMETVITGLLGEERMTGIRIKNNAGEEKTLAIDGLFVAVGQEPETEIVRDLVATDEKGYIVADENCRTDLEGVFVAGDCKAVRQLTTAAADGAVAALMAAEYLQ